MVEEGGRREEDERGIRKGKKRSKGEERRMKKKEEERGVRKGKKWAEG